ncbi:MAG TPA: thioredoxin domain-containing protein [Candidatus Sumerlaeota bacterium]|nr:thioredoxin domain-containing protein [Candidatus Sumerlaeota bacterium]
MMTDIQVPENCVRQETSLLNHLAGQSSSYLLQHAGNPVDWYPWGEAALERARVEKKLIFLSIGYSACHWCHVMERESFEDPETARILNAHFVCIKVDREERPDLDEIYMAAVQLMTGSGGWPLNVFLTPDLAPFWGGTYFPPVERAGLPAFCDVLESLIEVWQDFPDRIRQDGAEMRKALKEFWKVTPLNGHPSGEILFTRAMDESSRAFDSVWGGFGLQPKFPPWASLRFLMRQYTRSGQYEALQMADVTLDCMARGGIHDQIGGGFHRYSTDRQWRLPHFEKMLYDNAAAVLTYLEAWQITRKPWYRQVAVRTLDFLLREMGNAGGGFHASLDADNAGQEGEYYLWTPQKIEAAVGGENARFLGGLYGLPRAGSSEVGPSVLQLGHPSEERWPVSEADSARFEALRSDLLAFRERETPPGKDTKMIASWNGTVLSALACASQILQVEAYRMAAGETARFLVERMVEKGKLIHCWSPNHPLSPERIPGFLDDYADVILGLLDLYESTFDPRWIQEADTLMQTLLSEFWDEEAGGFYYTSRAHRDVLMRTKPTQDNGISSGNASATWGLLRLARFLDKPDYADRAERVFSLLSDQLNRHPLAYSPLLLALDFHLSPSLDIVLCGKQNSEGIGRFRQVLSERFLPGRVLAFHESGEGMVDKASGQMPLLSGKQSLDGQPVAYVCLDRTCLSPIQSPEELGRILDSKTVDNLAGPC